MNPFRKDNLVAWCIVPFDACKRGPEERAEMLQRLGISSMAFDWRDEHIPAFDQELSALRGRNIRMIAFYQLGGWPEDEDVIWANRRIRAGLDFFQRNSLNMDVWASYGGEGTEGLTRQEEKFEAAARRISILAAKVNSIGCRLSLYNHGGWGGEPENMVEIVRRLERFDVGIVYNFHHGHDHLVRMPDSFLPMLPYLRCVNLNGTTVGGEKIIPFGSGEEDLRILRMLLDSGYSGPIGILGHRSDMDVEVCLKQNLAGLRNLLAESGESEALATYR